MMSRVFRIAAFILAVLTITTSMVANGISASDASEQPFFSLLRSKSSPTYSLATVDPGTGATTSVKQLDFSQVPGKHFDDLRAAGYSENWGIFWAYDSLYQELFSIRPDTGIVSYHGTFSPEVNGGITAMAIDSSGKGYALGANNLIYSVFLEIAALYDPQPVTYLPSTTSDIESMSFVGSTLYAYAERSSTHSDVSPVLGYALQIEKINSKWTVTNSYYDNSSATGTMDAYGLVVQGNSYFVNQLVSGQNRLMTMTPVSGRQSVTFSPRGVMAGATDQLVRGLYATVPESIMFDSNGGSPVATVYGAKGTHFAEPVTPTRAGASFEGWFTARTGGTKITWPYTSNGSTTFYAQWNMTPATLSFDSHGGSPTTAISAFVGDEIQAPSDPVRSGYGFDGWYTAESSGMQVTWPYPLTGDTTLHAVWTQTPAVLTLKNENSSVDTITNSFVGVEIDEPVAPTRSQTHFKGWYTAQSGGTQVSWPYTLTGDTTLWAQWEANLQFASEGGTPVDTLVRDVGTSIAQPANPSSLYKNFSGWFTAATGGTAISWPYQLDTDTVIYARWTSIPATLVFDSQGGSAVNSISTFRGELVSEPSEPTKPNAAFEGWFTQSAGGEKITWSYLIAADTTVFAQWNTIPVTLSFDSQGGSPVPSINTFAGEEIDMPTLPSRPGYAFGGWYASLTDEESQVWPYEVQTDTVLYARWIKNSAELAATGSSQLNTQGLLGVVLFGLGLVGVSLARRRRYF